MAYFEDLSIYSYIDRHRLPNLINAGWLDVGHDFTRGAVPQGFLECLKRYCEVGVAHTRGFHECEFCQKPEVPTVINGLKLGSAEIRVFGSNNAIFAAPNLILHYVAAHGYRPPQQFIEAVMTAGGPHSDDYAKALVSAKIVASPCLRAPTPDSQPSTPRG